MPLTAHQCTKGVALAHEAQQHSMHSHLRHSSSIISWSTHRVFCNVTPVSEFYFLKTFLWSLVKANEETSCARHYKLKIFVPGVPFRFQRRMFENSDWPRFKHHLKEEAQHWKHWESLGCHQLHISASLKLKRLGCKPGHTWIEMKWLWQKMTLTEADFQRSKGNMFIEILSSFQSYTLRVKTLKFFQGDPRKRPG